ncbi:protein kinase [Trypanosoma rangeli]|uniref:Protein kinase n=1 Tax=Trypanosoma rangeli TaxID=5698 RepID=A0A422P1C1_TRYRA|nr:protein kinase [Trypanosoma rangeli]RNF11475.1 protein kinase [Trypanosoma rangeli]|eukprot:RNF11475.1 protein kinase [Trypanosoma rangeli]
MPEIKIEKHAIFVDKVEIVQRRIHLLTQWPSSPLLFQYKDARISPRYLILKAEPPVEGVLEPLQPPIREEEARWVVRGIVRALYALHSRQLVHGHLRLEVLHKHQPSGRILLAQHVFPIDLFVPSSDVGRGVWRCCAPEIRRSSVFDYSADIWALGAVFLQLVAPAGKLFETADLLEMDVLSPDLMSLSPSAVSFAVQCLQEEAGGRPTIAELLLHPFLTEKDNEFDSYESEEESTDEEA